MNNYSLDPSKVTYDKIALTELIGQYMKRHTLCPDGVREFCDEIGVPFPSFKFKTTINVDVEIEAFDSDEAEEALNAVCRTLGSDYVYDGHVWDIVGAEFEHPEHVRAR